MINNLITQASKMLNVNENELKQASNKALPYLSSVNDVDGAKKAMQQVGMPVSFIDKALSVLDSPKTQLLANAGSMFGMNLNVNEAKQKLNQLKQPQQQIPYSNNVANSSDPIAELRSGVRK